MLWGGIAVALAVAIMLMASSSPAQADGLILTGVDCSLEQAIESANTDTSVGGCAAGDMVDVIDLGGGLHELAPGTPAVITSMTIRNGTINAANAGGSGLVVSGLTVVRFENIEVTGGPAAGGISTALDWIGNVTFLDSSFFNNGRGVGIFGFGDVTIERSTFFSNATGAGIFGLGEATITNSTFSGNTGFGLDLAGGPITVTSTTAVLNSALDVNSGGSGSPTFQGSLVGTCGGLTGVTGDATNISTSNDCGGFIVDGNATLNLGPLESNGCTQPCTQTHMLLNGHAGIDVLATCPTLTDQRLVMRPQGTACDVGSFEAEGGGLHELSIDHAVIGEPPTDGWIFSLISETGGCTPIVVDSAAGGGGLHTQGIEMGCRYDITQTSKPGYASAQRTVLDVGAGDSATFQSTQLEPADLTIDLTVVGQPSGLPIAVTATLVEDTCHAPVTVISGDVLLISGQTSLSVVDLIPTAETLGSDLAPCLWDVELTGDADSTIDPPRREQVTSTGVAEFVANLPAGVQLVSINGVIYGEIPETGFQFSIDYGKPEDECLTIWRDGDDIFIPTSSCTNRSTPTVDPIPKPDYVTSRTNNDVFMFDFAHSQLLTDYITFESVFVKDGEPFPTVLTFEAVQQFEVTEGPDTDCPAFNKIVDVDLNAGPVQVPVPGVAPGHHVCTYRVLPVDEPGQLWKATPELILRENEVIAVVEVDPNHTFEVTVTEPPGFGEQLFSTGRSALFTVTCKVNQSYNFVKRIGRSILQVGVDPDCSDGSLIIEAENGLAEHGPVDVSPGDEIDIESRVDPEQLRPEEPVREVGFGETVAVKVASWVRGAVREGQTIIGEFNPVVWDAPIPEDNTIRFRIPDNVEPGTYDLTLTIPLLDGQLFIQTIPLVVRGRAPEARTFIATEDPTPTPTPAPTSVPVEPLAVVDATATPSTGIAGTNELAHTGSSTNMLRALALISIGLGATTLALAREWRTRRDGNELWADH